MKEKIKGILMMIPLIIITILLFGNTYVNDYELFKNIIIIIISALTTLISVVLFMVGLNKFSSKA